MERALESYEQRLIQMAKELEHFGLSAEQALDAVKIKSLFRRTIDQYIEQHLIYNHNNGKINTHLEELGEGRNPTYCKRTEADRSAVENPFGRVVQIC